MVTWWHDNAHTNQMQSQTQIQEGTVNCSKHDVQLRRRNIFCEGLIRREHVQRFGDARTVVFMLSACFGKPYKGKQTESIIYSLNTLKQDWESTCKPSRTAVTDGRNLWQITQQFRDIDRLLRWWLRLLTLTVNTNLQRSKIVEILCAPAAVNGQKIKFCLFETNLDIAK